MSKHQLVEAIRQCNRTADRDFLMSFNKRDLQVYLRRLGLVGQRNGSAGAWVRLGDTPAISSRGE